MLNLKKIKEAIIKNEVVTENVDTKEVPLRVMVLDQGGKIVKEFDNIKDAYAFAGENGYQVLG